MRRCLPALVLALLAGCSVHAPVVGSRVPPYPAGMDDLGGRCLSTGASCNHVLGELGKAKGPRYLVAEEKVGKDSGGKPLLKIVDILEYPRFPNAVLVNDGQCSEGNTRDEAIVAIVEKSDAEWYGDCRWARRFDRKLGRFVPVSEKAVKCRNPCPGHACE